MHPKDVKECISHCGSTFKEKNVVFVDISFNTEVMNVVCEAANKVLVIDHHVTAQKMLADFKRPNLYLLIEMGKASVQLTWEYVCSVSPIPRALEYIGLKDVWKHHDNPEAVFFTLAFECPPKDDWDAWIPYMFHTRSRSAFIENIIERGKVIAAHNTFLLKTMMEKVRYQKWRGYNIAIVNVPYPFISDIGEKMCQKDPESTVAVIWNKTAGEQYVVSLRTNNPQGPDCAKIATEFGGGGHVHSAGLRLDELPENVFKDTAQ